MDKLPDNLTETQAACLFALRAQLHKLEGTIDALLQLAMEQPEGLHRDQLMDKVIELDSCANLMRRALDVMDEARR